MFHRYSFNAHSGAFGLGLSGSAGQTLNTTVGQQYQIDFWLQGYFTATEFRVSFGGQIVFDEMIMPDDPYTKHTLFVTASSNLEDVVFDGRGGSVNLDDVSVTAVPEPGGHVLVGIGAACLLLSAARFGQNRGGYAKRLDLTRLHQLLRQLLSA
jgi:hypothetical protein